MAPRGTPDNAPFNNPFADQRVQKALRRQLEKPAPKPPPPPPSTPPPSSARPRPGPKSPSLRAPPRIRGTLPVLPAAPPRPPPPPPAPLPPGTPLPDDNALFLSAVDGVAPLPARPAPVEKPAPPLPPLRDPDAETAQLLARFVAGEGVLDVHDSDEAVESPPGSVDPALMRRLRRGEFSLQRHVDLHGFTVEEAHEAMRAFMERAERQHLRCVLVVHGRGLHSKDRNPVLKERVVSWLSAGALSRRVLAFCTARPHDGGAGALYVLLRAGPERRPIPRRATR